MGVQESTMKKLKEILEGKIAASLCAFIASFATGITTTDIMLWKKYGFLAKDIWEVALIGIVFFIDSIYFFYKLNKK